MGEERIMLRETLSAKTHRPYIAVRQKGKTATFMWTSSPESRLKSSVDLKIKIEWDEILWFAKILNCQTERNEIIFSNLDPYNRVLIYACVRKTIQSPRKASQLANLVLNLNSWEAFYWASSIREIWWEHKSVKKLYKAAKAFKILFNLE